jgi:hypothetical protein
MLVQYRTQRCHILLRRHILQQRHILLQHRTPWQHRTPRQRRILLPLRVAADVAARLVDTGNPTLSYCRF